MRHYFVMWAQKNPECFAVAVLLCNYGSDIFPWDSSLKRPQQLFPLLVMDVMLMWSVELLLLLLLCLLEVLLFRKLYLFWIYQSDPTEVSYLIGLHGGFPNKITHIAMSYHPFSPLIVFEYALLKEHWNTAKIIILCYKITLLNHKAPNKLNHVPHYWVATAFYIALMGGPSHT